MGTVDDALDGLSARELERLKARIERRLRTCFLCGNDGAIPIRAWTSIRDRGPSKGARMAFLMCPVCIERHRLPPSRAVSA